MKFDATKLRAHVVGRLCMLLSLVLATGCAGEKLVATELNYGRVTKFTIDPGRVYHRDIEKPTNPQETLLRGWCVALSTTGGLDPQFKEINYDGRENYPPPPTAPTTGQRIGSIWNPFIALSDRVFSGAYLSGTAPSVASDRDKTIVAASEGTTFIAVKVKGPGPKDWEFFVLPLSESRAKPVKVRYGQLQTVTQIVETGQYLRLAYNGTAVIPDSPVNFPWPTIDEVLPQPQPGDSELLRRERLAKIVVQAWLQERNRRVIP